MKILSSISFGEYCKSNESKFKTRLEYLDWYEKTRNKFDAFLKQPLKLEMFIPCDNEGNVIKPPTEKDKIDLGGGFATIEERQELEDWENDYQKAQEKVLFKGFEYINGNIYLNGNLFFLYKTESSISLEIYTSENLELTENAIKKLEIRI